MIFGGFQSGESKNTQLFVYHTKTHSFTGVESHLQFTDCFQLTPYHHNPEKKEDKLYSWSIYGNLHVLDMSTFKWGVVEDRNDYHITKQDFQPQNSI